MFHVDFAVNGYQWAFNLSGWLFDLVVPCVFGAAGGYVLRRLIDR